MTVFNLIVVGCWVVFIIYWFTAAFFMKKTVEVPWHWFVLRVVIVLAIVLYYRSSLYHTITTFHTVPSSHYILGSIGAFLSVAGIGFAIWARWHLGRNWGMPMTKKAEPELVTSGPYAFVRHPIYTGVICAVFGSAFVNSTVWAIPAVLLTAYFLYSAKAEEQFFQQQFPKQYPAYKKRTKMIIPYVY